MEIHYISDLHLESRSMYLSNVMGGKLLIIAGDLCPLNDIKEHLHVIDKLCGAYENVLFIPGNHEYYGRDLFDTSVDVSLPDNFKILENEWIKINGVRFYGGSMWTDMSHVTNKQDIHMYESMVSSFKHVTVDYRRLQLQDCTMAYNDFMEGLYEKIYDENTPVVVISHFPPSKRSLNPKFTHSTLNDFFTNDLDEVIKDMPINSWICGHVHHDHEYNINGITVRCNPRGYGFEENVFDFNSFEIACK